MWRKHRNQIKMYMIQNQERNEFVNLISLSQTNITLFEWIIEKASHKQQRWITNSCNPSVGWLFRESEKGKGKKNRYSYRKEKSEKKTKQLKSGERRRRRMKREEVRGGIRDWRLGTISTYWDFVIFLEGIFIPGKNMIFFILKRKVWKNNI